MNMKSWGIIGAVIIAAIIIIGGVFYYTNRAVAPEKSNTYSGTSTTAATPPNPPKVISPTTLDPTSGPIGTVVTIHGENFGQTNTIEMGGLLSASMKNVASANGTTLQFTVPATLGPNCRPNEACPQFLTEVTPRAYIITLLNNGTPITIGTFTVTAP